MNDRKSSRVDQILDLLVEEIEERMWARGEPVPAAEPPLVEALSPLAPSPAELVGPVEVVEAPVEPETELEGQLLEPEPELLDANQPEERRAPDPDTAPPKHLADNGNAPNKGADEWHAEEWWESPDEHEEEQ